MKKKITVVSSCFNEVENLEEFCRRVKAAFEELPEYEFDMIIADNCSTDGSRELLRRLAAEDRRIKVVRLSEAGAQRCRASEQGMAEAEAHILSSLTEAEREIFTMLLRKVRDSLT